MSARPLVAGTIARGHLQLDQGFFTGRVNGELVRELPIEVTRQTLRRGRERYDIYCSPCHDRAGYGGGMVAQRGFPAPPSYHIDRLREMPPGHFFEVMTQGFGRMPSYADQVPPEDRWAIAAYVQALQLSQHARADELPESILDRLPPRRP
jgi:mono/diheme cytochrome c family protein